MTHLMRAFLTLFILVYFVSTAFAQVVVVIQPVNLRTNPSTNHPPLRLLLPLERLQLIPPKEQDDFYHVRTENREEKWA